MQLPSETQQKFQEQKIAHFSIKSNLTEEDNIKTVEDKDNGSVKFRTSYLSYLKSLSELNMITQQFQEESLKDKEVLEKV